jgi:hypothetical protein
MSEATVIIGTAPEAGNQVAPEVIPDSPMPKAEIQPEVVPETPTPSPERSDVDIYRDLIGREANGESVDMTPEEVDAFMSVQEQIMSGAIKDPGLSEKPNETPKPEEKSETTPEPKAEAEATPTGDDAPVGDVPEMSMAQADYLQKAMTQVGAKDISELPKKVEGLINQMKATGGKLGGEAKHLQSQLDQHVNFMQGLKAGDPQATAHFKKLMGKAPSQIIESQEGKTPQATNESLDMLDSEEYLDNQLAPVVKSLIGKVNDLVDQNKALQQKDSQRDQSNLEAKATTSWVDNVVGLIADHSEDYGLNTSEARALATFYWSPDGAKTAVHPKFQKIHELIKFAHTGNYPDLETAHVMLQHKNGGFSQKLIDATKKGAKDASHTESPNSAISSRQGRVKSDIPNPSVTEDMVTAMEKGDINAIPDEILDEWTDDQGNLLRDKVPERFHDIAFGRAR